MLARLQSLWTAHQVLMECLISGTLTNSNSYPMYLHKRNENYAQIKTDLYKNNHRSFSHKSQNLKTTQVLLNKEMDTQTVAHPYNRTVISTKRKELLMHTAAWMDLSVLLNEAGQEQLRVLCLHV